MTNILPTGLSRWVMRTSLAASVPGVIIIINYQSNTFRSAPFLWRTCSEWILQLPINISTLWVHFGLTSHSADGYDALAWLVDVRSGGPLFLNLLGEPFVRMSGNRFGILIVVIYAKVDLLSNVRRAAWPMYCGRRMWGWAATFVKA